MSKVDAVKAEYAKKIADAEREDAIAAQIPTFYRSIHLYPLHGTVGNVSYGDNYKHGDAVSMTAAGLLLRSLPPVAMTMVRDSCLSFMPTVYVDSLSEEKKDRWQEESSISSVSVKIEALHGAKAILEWTTNLEGVGLLRVTVHLGDLWPLKIGTYSAKKKEFKGGFRYERATFAPANEMHTIFSESGEPLAQLEAPIRWASGSDEYPSNMTLYFVDLGADLNPADVGLAIVRQIAKQGAV